MFSFGVVLLELITGRKPVDQARPGEESLVEWVETELFPLAHPRTSSACNRSLLSSLKLCLAMTGTAGPRGRRRDGRPRRGGRPPARGRLQPGPDDRDGGGRGRVRPPLGSQAPADGAGN